MLFTLVFKLKPDVWEPEYFHDSSICGTYKTLWQIWFHMKDNYDITIRDINGFEMNPEAGIVPAYK